MRLPWTSAKPNSHQPPTLAQPSLFYDKPAATGEPLQVAVDLIDEDPNNPRTEFIDAEINELANDIAQRGILQPIVVDAADAAGRYRIRFGAHRLRAARRAGLATVPVSIATAAFDAYAQVAENLKRHRLSPMDLARFIQRRIDAGDSNATIARNLVIDQTTVAHHLALLSLPPALDEVLKAGRCTSPRTLYELSKLHDQQPDAVVAVLHADAPITRKAVATLRDRIDTETSVSNGTPTVRRPAKSPLDQAELLCDRLEAILTRASRLGAEVHADRVARLRSRLAELSRR